VELEVLEDRVVQVDSVDAEAVRTDAVPDRVEQVDPEVLPMAAEVLGASFLSCAVAHGIRWPLLRAFPRDTTITDPH
jgi:hypothetical protein